MGEPKPEVRVLDEEAEAKPQSANKNGKKSDGAGGTSFFTWFMVLALLGVWTSVAVVYFDLVDYQGVIGKLVSYDADGDGDFDVEDAKVLLDERQRGGSRKKEQPFSKDVGLKLREALKQQLAIIHERVEARKIAKMALMEVRNLIAKEDQEKALDKKREEAEFRAREKADAWFKKEGERIEKEEMEKAMERVKREKEEAEKLAAKDEAKKAKKIEGDEGKKPERDKKSPSKTSDSEGKKVEKDGKGPKDGKSKTSTKKASKTS